MPAQPEQCPIPGATHDAMPPVARAITSATHDAAPPVARDLGAAAFANPVITAQPDPLHSVAANTDVTLAVACTGAAPLAWQWYKDGTPQAGKTTPAITVKAAAATAGTYTCKIKNDYGETETTPALIELIA